MPLQSDGKQAIAERFKYEGRHFQIYGTYYPSGTGGSSITFPTDVDTQLIGTGGWLNFAFERNSNVLTLNTAQTPYDNMEFTVTVPVGAVLDIEGVRIYAGEPGGLGVWECTPSDSANYPEILYHEFEEAIRFTSDGTFTITGFQITVN